GMVRDAGGNHRDLRGAASGDEELRQRTRKASPATGDHTESAPGPGARGAGVVVVDHPDRGAAERATAVLPARHESDLDGRVVTLDLIDDPTDPGDVGAARHSRRPERYRHPVGCRPRRRIQGMWPVPRNTRGAQRRPGNSHRLHTGGRSWPIRRDPQRGPRRTLKAHDRTFGCLLGHRKTPYRRDWYGVVLGWFSGCSGLPAVQYAPPGWTGFSGWRARHP